MPTFKEIERNRNVYITWITDRADGGLIPHHLYFALPVFERFIQPMTAAEEKFSKFFKDSYDKAQDVSQMSMEDLSSWIIELEDIILTAKASVQGATLGKRERVAKLSASEREKLCADGDSTQFTSDAISSVTKRKDRMSKMDKLAALYDGMVKAGTMSREDADSMLGLVKVDESKQSTTSFNANKKDQIDTAKLAQEALDKAKKESESKIVTPTEGFDFDSLFK